MRVNRLTHTVTHTRKCPDRPKEYRRGGFASSPVFLSSFCSHDLRHKAAHGLCGFILLLPGGVDRKIMNVVQYSHIKTQIA